MNVFQALGFLPGNLYLIIIKSVKINSLPCSSPSSSSSASSSSSSRPCRAPDTPPPCVGIAAGYDDEELGASSSAPSGPALSSAGGKLVPDKLANPEYESPWSKKNGVNQMVQVG